MSLLLRTNYAIARSSLKRQKLRTFLTSLGIAIGIASIIYTFGIIGSFKNLVKSETNDALLVLQQKSDEATDISSILTAKPLIIKKLSNSSKNPLIPPPPFHLLHLSPVISQAIISSLTVIFLVSTNRLLKFSALKLKLALSRVMPASKLSS